MKEDWTDFKKTFTQDQEDAIWQFLIDHSQVQKNGYLGIQLYVRDVDDLWKRIYARKTGNFKRYEAQDKMTRQRERWARDKLVQIKEIQNRGSFWMKTLLRLNGYLNKILFKKK